MSSHLEKAEAALEAAGKVAVEIDDLNKTHRPASSATDALKAKEHDFNRLMDIASVQAAVAQARALEAIAGFNQVGLR